MLRTPQTLAPSVSATPLIDTIRTVTMGTPLDHFTGVDSDSFGFSLKTCRGIAGSFQDRGLAVRTQRVVTEPVRSRDVDRIISSGAATLPMYLAAAEGFNWATVPFAFHDFGGDLQGGVDAALRLMEEHPNIFVNLMLSQPNEAKRWDHPDLIDRFRASMAVFDGVSRFDVTNGAGAFRLAASFNVPSNGPYFPATWHDGETAVFSLAPELTQAFHSLISDRNGLSEADLQEKIVRELSAEIRALDQQARALSDRLGIRYTGMDLSLAPLPSNESEDSVAELVKALGVEIGSGDLDLTMSKIRFLTQTLKRIGMASGARLVGFHGAMLSPAEDRGFDTTLNYDPYLWIQLAQVCGVGLDMVALAGETDDRSLMQLYGMVHMVSQSGGLVQSGIPKPLMIRYLLAKVDERPYDKRHLWLDGQGMVRAVSLPAVHPSMLSAGELTDYSDEDGEKGAFLTDVRVSKLPKEPPKQLKEKYF